MILMHGPPAGVLANAPKKISCETTTEMIAGETATAALGDNKSSERRGAQSHDPPVATALVLNSNA